MTFDIKKHLNSLDVLVEGLTGKSAELIFMGKNQSNEGFKKALENGKIPIMLPIKFNDAVWYESQHKYAEFLTALQAGRLIYGGTILDIEDFSEMVNKVYDQGLLDPYENVVWNLDGFFKTFKRASLAKQIFEVVESARINSHLARDYLGYKQLMQEELPKRFSFDLINQQGYLNISDLDAAVLTLLQYKLFLGHLPDYRLKAESREKIQDLFQECRPIADKVLEESANLADSFIATIQLYNLIYERVKRKKESPYKQKPKLLKGLESITKKEFMIIDSEENLQEIPIFKETSVKIQGDFKKHTYHEWNSEKNTNLGGFNVYDYDDHTRYETIKRTIVPNHALVKKIRDEFALLKPEGRLVLKKQRSGELDYERYVQYQAELAAGVTPDERIYKKVLNRKRDTAALILIDLSGSTNKWISEDKQIIDVIAESVYYLSCGVNELDDLLGVYGYSSYARRKTHFEPIANFGEAHPDNTRFVTRLKCIAGLKQNQDGLAIRHATKKLLDTGRKNLVLIHISDGEPESVYLKRNTHDIDDIENAALPPYKGDYAWQDTRRALSEARASGVTPVCIRVNDQKSEGLEKAYGTNYKILPNPLNLQKVLCSVYKDLIA